MPQKKSRRAAKPSKRTFDARPDTLDFRDRMFEPSLIEVPVRITLDEYRKHRVPILDQGTEGACTGFGLATVANFLLRRRKVIPDPKPVSPRMLYEMARRYDEWPGEDYSGSSARGAMKAWHKHGICSEKHWPYTDRDRRLDLFPKRWSDAVRRPLGAYYRVNHKDIIAMHTALAEVGVLYATSSVHAGWPAVGRDGIISHSDDSLGVHAFAIVAYDEQGFWIQNSWGPTWGLHGFGRFTYDDWLANGTDVWVARLGAPIVLRTAESTATGVGPAAQGSRSYMFCDLRPHIISIGNDGAFRSDGMYGTTKSDADEIIKEEFPRRTKTWKKKRLLLYAHGGLVGEDTSVQRVADYRAALLEREVYPLSFIWKTDFWSTLTNIIQDALKRRRPEGILDKAKDFMLDRLDDALEPVARALTGKALWSEMRENALLATESKKGALRHVANLIASLPKKGLEVHVIAHSAGSILQAPLISLLSGDLGVPISTCTLWAPACTIKLFRERYLPAIQSGGIQQFTLFTLTDKAEQDDNCASIYHKSLLYLVSNALEEFQRKPLTKDGEPLLGLAKFVDSQLKDIFSSANAQWVRSPNDAEIGSPDASTATSHGSFDDDPATLQATLARILGSSTAGKSAFPMHRSAAGQRTLRHRLEVAS